MAHEEQCVCFRSVDHWQGVYHPPTVWELLDGFGLDGNTASKLVLRTLDPAGHRLWFSADGRKLKKAIDSAEQPGKPREIQTVKRVDRLFSNCTLCACREVCRS